MASLEAFTRAAAASGKVAALMQPYYDIAGVQLSQARYREALVSSTCGVCAAFGGVITPGGILIRLACTSMPEGKEHMQLLGLACSMLKYHAAFADSQMLQDPLQPQQAALSIAELGLGGMDLTPPVADKVAMVAICACLVLMAAADLRSTADTAAAVAAAAQGEGALSVLPWLMLLGRCFLVWANQLQHLGAAGLAPAAGSAAPSAAWLFIRRAQAGFSLLDMIQGACHLWLSKDDIASELQIAGYDLDGLVHKLFGLQGSLQALWSNPDGASQRSALVSSVQALAQELCAVAAPAICNNPHCSNVSGPSELVLVSGRSAVCGGCRVAHYCSRDCQRQHWKQHKPVCQALEATAAAAKGAKAKAGAKSGAA
jgi:hypothetical protein